MALITHADWLDRFGAAADLAVDEPAPPLTYRWAFERRVSPERRVLPRVNLLARVDHQRRLAQDVLVERRATRPR